MADEADPPQYVIPTEAAPRAAQRRDLGLAAHLGRLPIIVIPPDLSAEASAKAEARRPLDIRSLGARDCREGERAAEGMMALAKTLEAIAAGC